MKKVKLIYWHNDNIESLYSPWNVLFNQVILNAKERMVLEQEWKLLQAVLYWALEEQKDALYFAHNLFSSKKDSIIISKNTLIFFRNQKKISSSNITLFYCLYPDSKIGIKISKKAIPLAVSRNSLRRKLRETFRSYEFDKEHYAVLLSISNKIQAEKKDINDILLREWISLLNQLQS